MQEVNHLKVPSVLTQLQFLPSEYYMLLLLICRYQILSKYTAFVAIDKRTEAVEGTMQLRAMKLQKAGTTSRATYSYSGRNYCSSVAEINE